MISFFQYLNFARILCFFIVFLSMTDHVLVFFNLSHLNYFYLVIMVPYDLILESQVVDYIPKFYCFIVDISVKVIILFDFHFIYTYVLFYLQCQINLLELFMAGFNLIYFVLYLFHLFY